MLAVVLFGLAPAGLVPGRAGDRAWAAPPSVTAEGAVLWDPADEATLYGKAEGVGRPMASTTKIMTVLLALERADIDDLVSVSAEAAARGGASLGLQPAQELPLGSLLAGLLLRSGNDGAAAVAEHVAGDVEAFVDLMNTRADELGLDDTHFVDVTGLTDDPDHRASPLDLARLADVAMARPEFAAWAGAAALRVPGLGAVTNRNELLGTYPGATGVKTGFTRLAGQTLVASAARRGRRLYAVVLGSEDRAADAAALLDHGFEDFRRPAPVAAGQRVATYRWADAATPLVAEEELAVTVPADSAVTWRAELDPVRPRPLPRGTTVGRARLVVDGSVEDVTPLTTAERVAAPGGGSPGALAGGAVHEALRALGRTVSADRPLTERVDGERRG